MSGNGHAGGMETAARHALGWLLFGNLAGLWLSVLLLWPDLGAGEWTYGRWVPVHLNVQLYGWTSLPLVAWLMAIYQVDASRVRRWGSAAVWAWTAALAAGVLHWLHGVTSGKIFLDWKFGSLTAFVLAQGILWLVLALAWWDRAWDWKPLKRWLGLAGLFGLALVPLSLAFASSPTVYPPVDRTTGGPTGSSLLGSTLFVVGLMWLLPRAMGIPGKTKPNPVPPAFFIVSWIVFAITEWIGGSHFDWWQIAAMVMLLPWVWLLPRDWVGRDWPPPCAPWRKAMFFWWALLVVSGLLMYAPGVLDRLKFTQGLVAHSHLAMAGFTTSFCAHLLVLLTGRPLGGKTTVLIWNAAAFGMVAALATGGWLEGGGPSWMLETPVWRTLVFIARALCGAVMVGVAATWFTRWKSPS